MTAASSGSGSSQTFGWSDRGKVITSSGTSGNSTFGYDADGLLTQRLESVGGFSSAISYNGAGQEATYFDQITATTVSTSYSVTTGELTGKSWAAGSLAVTYDPFGRTATTTVKNASNTNVQKITYGYDNNSNLTNKTVEGGVQLGGEYQYDLADRLTQWSPRHPTLPIGSIYPRQYRWDNNGNARLSRTVNIFEQQWSYDARNRVTATSMDWDGDYYLYPVETSPAGQVTYLGDANRNLTYDALGQLIGDKATTYKYDGLGRLAERTTGTTTQQFAYAGASSQPYRAPASTTAIEAVGRASNGTILTSSFGPRIALPDAHGDILGGIASAGAASGTLVSSVGYEPFGEIWSGSATPTQQRSAFGFQGSWTDSQTGSVWMGTRWYDPYLGSFLSRDDTRFDFTGAPALNLYAYGNGNPVKYIDPDGRNPIAVFLAAAGLTAVQAAVLGTVLVGAGVAASYAISELANGRDLATASASASVAGAMFFTGAYITAQKLSVGVGAWVASSTDYLMTEMFKFGLSTLAANCYLFMACGPHGTLGSTTGKDDTSAAPTQKFTTDTTIDLSQAESQLKTIADGTIGTVTSFVAASVAADACGIGGTIQSCISPDRTVPSACAGPASPAGLCTPSRPIPGTGTGSGPTLPVKPITEGSITNTAGLAIALGIAFAISAPQGPEEPKEECIPEPDGESVDTGDVSVYRSVDSDGVVRYVGITNNLERRASEHSPMRIEPMQGLGNLSRSDAKAVEQVLMESYGGPKSMGGTQLKNAINSISPKNDIYRSATQRGRDILESVGYGDLGPC